MSDNESLKLIIQNQQNLQEQFTEFKKENREDINEVKKKVDLLGSQFNMKLDKHVEKDEEDFNSLRKGQTKISLTMAKLSGIRATILYLVPGVGFIAWLVFKTVFGIVDK